MQTREQLPTTEHNERQLDDLLGNPGAMLGVRAEAEAAIRMKTADWVVIEETVDPVRAEEEFKKKLASIQDELHHYVESLELAQEKGVEGIVIPEFDFSDEFAEELIEAAREDPRTWERVDAQIEALGIRNHVDNDVAETPLPELIDPIESKDDIYGHEMLHTAKQRLTEMGRRAVDLLVKH